MNSIRDMPVHNHPRDKLGEKGASAATDEELLAAILGMGTGWVAVCTIGHQDPIFKLTPEMLYC